MSIYFLAPVQIRQVSQRAPPNDRMGWGRGPRETIRHILLPTVLLCLQCSIVVKQVTQTGTLPILHDRDVTNGKFTLVESNSSESGPAIFSLFFVFFFFFLYIERASAEITSDIIACSDYATLNLVAFSFFTKSKNGCSSGIVLPSSTRKTAGFP